MTYCSSANLISVGANSAIFCERTQRLLQLNDTAAFIWRELQAGAAVSDVFVRLSAGGLDEAALVASRHLINEWVRAGFVVPRPVRMALKGKPASHFLIAVGDQRFALQTFGSAQAHALESVFGHFAVGDEAPSAVFSVVGHAGLDYVFQNEACLGGCERIQTPPRVKAALTAQFSAAERTGFLLHAALVTLNGRRLLLCGAPGVGKTTLTLALVAAGLEFGGDDIVLVDANGGVSPICFAAAAKSGAWPLLESMWPPLMTTPQFTRPDGQEVRYFLPERRVAGAGPVDAVLLLERRNGAAATLRPAPEIEALCSLLDSGYSSRAGLDTPTLAAFARNVSDASCFRFAYDALYDAVSLIRRQFA